MKYKENLSSKIMNVKIGVIPLPLYVVLAAIIYGASVYNKLPADMIGGFAVIMIMGIFLGDIGMRIPILKISVVQQYFRYLFHHYLYF